MAPRKQPKYSPSHKTCYRCQVRKPASEFYGSKANSDSLSGWCKVCSADAKRKAYVPSPRQYEVLYPGLKRCTKCDEVKCEADFGPGKRYRGGLRTWCLDCCSTYVQAKYCQSPIKARLRAREYSYGVTPEQFGAMEVAQGHACAICANPFKDTRDTHIDHDHATGEVRGLLCAKCNKGLGNFRDTPDLLVSAAAYLARHKASKLEAT